MARALKVNLAVNVAHIAVRRDGVYVEVELSLPTGLVSTSGTTIGWEHFDADPPGDHEAAQKLVDAFAAKQPGARVNHELPVPPPPPKRPVPVGDDAPASTIVSSAEPLQ